jgi:hypothetical protein
MHRYRPIDGPWQPLHDIDFVRFERDDQTERDECNHINP